VSSVDLIVVGSGPSGAQAAKQAIEAGLTVTVVDVGNDDPELRAAIPAGSFSALRRHDPEQWRYFAGPAGAQGAGDVRVGAQLTPPRQFITAEVDELLPFASDSFFPLRSLALGGLGAGWGAGTVTYSESELRRAGLPADEMARCYDAVAGDIGISGDANDDTGEQLLRCRPLEPPLPLDTNAAALFATYRARRAAAARAGLTLGRTPLAMLSRPRNDREPARDANPLEDMDFYSDRTRSVYRPRYTIEELSSRAGFRYADRTLAARFVQQPHGVELHARDLRTGRDVQLEAKRLVLACGALGTTRLVLASLDRYDVRVPLLANGYAYVPCINLPMLGRPAADRRHSLSQLSGVLMRPQPDDALYLSFYSYRSLLLYKLVKEMPLPPAAGLLAARLLLSALTIVGVNFPERPTSEKWMALRRCAGGPDELTAQYASGADEAAFRKAALRDVGRALRLLRCIPLTAIDPGNGSSIHYAGGLRITPDAGDPLGTDADGRLHAAPSVYVGDSANWRFLPAKGPTLTMMANARRVVLQVARELSAARA
jgi:choline dehydrogenase-like flavoprotein